MKTPLEEIGILGMHTGVANVDAAFAFMEVTSFGLSGRWWPKKALPIKP